MAADQTTDPEFDSRQGDPVYHQRSPADSGSASSFANRHNEGPPGEGHESAAHDRKTGAPVHGDGTPNEELPAQWDKGEASGQDPAAKEVEAGEAEHDPRPAGSGQVREAHPEERER